MIVRIVGTVIAGVYFFPPSIFLGEEPRGQKRESLMMMPTHPIANLILGKSRVAFGPLQTFLDPMLGFGHAGELSQRRFRRGVRQEVIVFHRAVVLRFPQDYEHLFRTV